MADLELPLSKALAFVRPSLIELGWGPYQNDHEDANGQFEMNWDFDDALTTADRQVFFKFMVKSIAELHGMRATFMPKPFSHLTGNGCHSHLSIWSLDGSKNLFNGDDDSRAKSAVDDKEYRDCRETAELTAEKRQCRGKRADGA